MVLSDVLCREVCPLSEDPLSEGFAAYLVLVVDLQESLVGGQLIHQLLRLLQEVLPRHTSLLLLESWSHCLGVSAAHIRLLVLGSRGGGEV